MITIFFDQVFIGATQTKCTVLRAWAGMMSWESGPMYPGCLFEVSNQEDTSSDALLRRRVCGDETSSRFLPMRKHNLQSEQNAQD
jgi:hypothetical protein